MKSIGYRLESNLSIPPLSRVLMIYDRKCRGVLLSLSLLQFALVVLFMSMSIPIIIKFFDRFSLE